MGRAVRSRLLEDPEDHHRPDDDGAERQGQRHGVSTQRGAGSRSEPAETEHDQADAPKNDHAVHESFEVVASVCPAQQCSDDRTNRGADQRRTRRARPADEQDPSYEQAGDHPLSHELLGTDPRDERAPAATSNPKL